MIYAGVIGGGGGTGAITEGEMALAAYSGADNNTASPAPFADEIYDTGDFWDAGADTLLSIPAGATGVVRYQFNHYSGSTSGYRQEDAAGSTRGYVHEVHDIGGGGGLSAPLAVTGGEGFRLARLTGELDTFFCWHSLEVLDPDISYALAYLTSGQTISSANTWEVISWDAVEADTDSYWAGGSPTRFTVPATGVYRVTMSAETSSSAGQQDYRCTVNGSALPGMMFIANGKVVSGVVKTSACSAPLQLTAGDYVEIWQRSEAASGGVIVSDYTWAAVERLDDAHPYCLVAKTNAQNVDNSTVAVTFNTEVHDPLGMFSPTSTTITIPAGYSYARVIANAAVGATAAAQIAAQISSNTDQRGYYSTPLETSLGGGLNAVSAWIPVSGGETCTVGLYTITTEAINSGGNVTWFCVELKA